MSFAYKKNKLRKVDQGVTLLTFAVVPYVYSRWKSLALLGLYKRQHVSQPNKGQRDPKRLCIGKS